MALPNPQPPVLTGGVQERHYAEPPDFKSTVIDADPEGWGALPDTDKMAVAQQFFKTHYESNPDFSAMPQPDRDQVRKTFFDSNIKPAPIAQLSASLPTSAPQQHPLADLRPQGLEAFGSNMQAQVNYLRNTHPTLANAFDFLTPQVGLGEGFLQGLSAQSYNPPEQANENIIRQTQRGIGNFAGTAAGFMGLAPVLTPGGAGAVYGLGGGLNQQLDEGRNLQNLNYGRLAANTAFGAATGILPPTFGQSLPVRLASGAALGGGLNAGSLAMNQAFENGGINLSDPAYLQAFAAGAGLGAGASLAGGRGNIKPGLSAREKMQQQQAAEMYRNPPIGMGRFNQRPPALPKRALQGHASYTQDAKIRGGNLREVRNAEASAEYFDDLQAARQMHQAAMQKLKDAGIPLNSGPDGLSARLKRAEDALTKKQQQHEKLSGMLERAKVQHGREAISRKLAQVEQEYYQAEAEMNRLSGLYREYGEATRILRETHQGRMPGSKRATRILEEKTRQEFEQKSTKHDIEAPKPKDFKDKGGQSKGKQQPKPQKKDFSQAELDDIQQARRELQAKVVALQEKHGVQETIEINTPEREALRAKVAQQVYGDGAARQEKRADIVLGVPGSGKSSAVSEPLAKNHGSLILDSDMVKEKLPEFDGGIGASVVHEESSQIMKQAFLRAVGNDDNIVLPLVGGNEKSLRAKIDFLKDAGYSVNLHYVDVPLDEAASRVYSRYKETGRFVDPENVFTVGLKSKQNFDKMIVEDTLNGYTEYDNAVPLGTPARVVRSSEGRVPETAGEAERPGLGQQPGPEKGTGRAQSQAGTGSVISSGFKTAKGSVYKIEGEGTARQKAATGESFDASDKTVFVTGQINKRLMEELQANNIGGRKASIRTLDEGSIALVVKDRKTGRVIDDASRVFEYTDQPKVGLHPVEVWNKNDKGEYGFHLGNAITEVEPAGPRASETQAAEAAAIRKQRAKEEQRGHMLISGSVKVDRSPKAFDSDRAGVMEVLGSTRKEPEIIAQMKEGFNERFRYMWRVKEKDFDIGGRVVSGNKFIALVDRLKSKMQDGYNQAEGKIKNAVEHLDDSPGYKAQEKLDDATRYLLYADYLRRAKQGQPVPGGLTMEQLKDGVNALQAHIRKHPDVNKAVLNIRRLLNELGRDLANAGLLEGTRKQYFPHQVLEHLDDFYGLPSSIKSPSRGYTKQAKGSEKEIETDLIGALNAHLKAIERHNAVDDFIKQVIHGFALKNWKPGDALPPGFVEFQPRSKRQTFMTMESPEQAALLAAAEKIMGSADPETRAILARVKAAIKMKTFAMPEEIVGYMNKIYEPRYLEGSNNILSKVLRAWKGAVTAGLWNPKVLAFHFKNAVGDFEVGLRDDPKLNLYLARATKELLQAKGGDPTESFLTAKEWGTIGGGYFGSELGFQGDMHWARRFGKGKIDKLITRTPGASQVLGASRKFGDLVQQLGQAREDQLRYAKFLRDTDLGLEPWQAHIENGKVFINYSHLTPFEKTVLRDTLFPFWSFYKGNAVNWASAMVGQRGAGAAARAWLLGSPIGLPLAIAVWNQIHAPEEEDRLQNLKSKNYIANQSHIWTPFEDSNGNKIIVLLPTASNQAMQLYGTSRLPYRFAKVMQEINEGHGTMTDVLKGQISASLDQDLLPTIGKGEGLRVPRPVSETLELLNPFLKEGMEQMFDYDLFMGKQITRPGEDVPEEEQIGRRLKHVAKVALPPSTTVEKIFGGTTDPMIATADLLVGVLKAPNLYSWADLKQEEQAQDAEENRIQNPELRSLREEARKSLFAEQSRLVYGGKEFDGEKYGKALRPDQRLRVQQILKNTTQGNGLGYSASAKYGFMKLVRLLDKAYQRENLTPQQRAKLDRFKAKLPVYLSRLQSSSEQRVKAAVHAVRMTNDYQKQTELYKAMTRRFNIPVAATPDYKNKETD